MADVGTTDGAGTPVESPSTATVSAQQSEETNALISKSAKSLEDQAAQGFEAINTLAMSIGAVQQGLNDNTDVTRSTNQGLMDQVKNLVLAVKIMAVVMIMLIALLAVGGPLLYAQGHGIHKTQQGNASLLQFVKDSQDPKSDLYKRNQAATTTAICGLETTIAVDTGHAPPKCP